MHYSNDPHPSNDFRHDEHGRLCSHWSELGFQDLGDDEAFLVWAYRCWQQDRLPGVAAQHQLTELLRQDRLNALLADLLNVFESFGRDTTMRESLQGFPLLTWREELLLEVLGDASASVGMACQEPLERCRAGLACHGVVVRRPQLIPRGGRDVLELQIARSFGAHWGPPGY